MDCMHIQNKISLKHFLTPAAAVSSLINIVPGNDSVPCDLAEGPRLVPPSTGCPQDSGGCLVCSAQIFTILAAGKW